MLAFAEVAFVLEAEEDHVYDYEEFQGHECDRATL